MFGYVVFELFWVFFWLVVVFVVFGVGFDDLVVWYWLLLGGWLWLWGGGGGKVEVIIY